MCLHCGLKDYEHGQYCDQCLIAQLTVLLVTLWQSLLECFLSFSPSSNLNTIAFYTSIYFYYWSYQKTGSTAMIFKWLKDSWSSFRWLPDDSSCLSWRVERGDDLTNSSPVKTNKEKGASNTWNYFLLPVLVWGLVLSLRNLHKLLVLC